jgi:hypothetical protein
MWQVKDNDEQKGHSPRGIGMAMETALFLQRFYGAALTLLDLFL